MWSPGLTRLDSTDKGIKPRHLPHLRNPNPLDRSPASYQCIYGLSVCPDKEEENDSCFRGGNRFEADTAGYGQVSHVIGEAGISYYRAPTSSCRLTLDPDVPSAETSSSRAMYGHRPTSYPPDDHSSRSSYTRPLRTQKDGHIHTRATISKVPFTPYDTVTPALYLF